MITIDTSVRTHTLLPYDRNFKLTFDNKNFTINLNNGVETQIIKLNRIRKDYINLLCKKLKVINTGLHLHIIPLTKERIIINIEEI